MKQKKFFFLAAAAMFMAACSENDVIEKQSPQQTVDDGAIVFDAYQSRNTTRAGATGVMDLTKLKESGFGVFSYYTNDEGYSELAKPDFMYNQEVSFSGNWLYSPIKYWPNEFGQEAASERVDYLTFFAYAPYVYAEPKTGKVATTSSETGIIGLTRNTAIGDPLVKYVANFNPAKCVDLCWGVVADDNFTASVTGTGDPKNNIEKGKPYIDVIKPLTNSKIKFDFKHALTQLNVQIDADIDQESHGTNALNDQTRIFVRSVSFEGFTDRGCLNLNSNAPTPIWYDIAGTGNLSTNPISIYDGRYDGREGVAHVSAPAESPLGLNSVLIQDEAYGEDPFTSTKNGVVSDPVNLFASNVVDAPILVVPNGQPLTVKVVYDVETYDPNLAQFLSDGKTKGSTIENAIKQTIHLTSSTDAMILEAGKKYIVKLHLGLTSVKFDADVTAWDDTDPDVGEGDLPVNDGPDTGTPVAAGTLAVNGTLDINMPAAGGSYTFTYGDATTPLADGDITITSAPTGVTLSGTPTVTAGAGKADVTIVVPPNTTTAIKSYTVTVKDATGTPQTAEINITQAYKPLGLTITTPAFGAQSTFVLGSEATDVDFSAATTTITRKRAGVTQSITPTSVAANGVVTLSAPATAGDVYTITVQAGAAEAETVSFTVAKQNATIAFGTPSPTNPSAFAAGAYDLGDEILTNAAALADAASVALTADADHGGTIAYTVDNDTYFEVTSAGVLKFKAGWNPGDSRTVTVTATVTAGVNYIYAEPSKSYTITVATAATAP